MTSYPVTSTDAIASRPGRHAGVAGPPPSGPPGPPPSGTSGFSVAAWCAAHRWRTLLAGLLVVAGAFVLLSGGLTSTSSTDQLVGDSAIAAKLSAGADFGTRPTETVVVTTRAGALEPVAVQRLGVELRRSYSGLRGIAAVGDPVLAPDGRTVVLAVQLDAVADVDGQTPPGRTSPGDAVGPMLAATRSLAAAHPELRIGQVGPGSIDSEVGRQLDQDFQRAELISLGLTAWTSRTLTPVDQNTQSLVLLIGLAVGVDYALFVIRRSREERAAGAGVRESIGRAGRTAGRAVLISGATVVVAMSGMLVAGGMFTSLAIGAMLVVGVAVVASATLLPALLAVLGDRVEALRLPFSRRRAGRRGSEHSVWGRIAGLVSRRPLAWGLASGAVLIALAAPALGMRTSLPGVEGLPRSFQVVDTYQRLTAVLPQDGTTVDVVVQAPASSAGRVDAALRSAYPVALATGTVAASPAGSGAASSAGPQISVSTDRTVQVLKLAVPVSESDPRLGAAVDAIRAHVTPGVVASLAGVPGASVHVGGSAAVTDLTRWLDQRLPWVVGFVLVLTFLVMLVSFGSPALAAATIGLNALSVGAAFGVITLVFQHTWAQGLLGFTSIGSIAAWLPLLMFVILFGLSMDYHVFVVSRVREAFVAGAAPREAVRIGVARSAGVVTSAAAVMVAVFAVFATLSTLEMKQLGVGLATAVLLDATLVRGLLLPAVLALLGRRAHTGPRWIPVLHH
jgi:RND superfamily putative drug exporter